MSHKIQISGSDQTNKFIPLDRCAQVVPPILIALSIIALLAGTLMIMAQNGIPMGGLNSICKMIAPQWVYLGMGISGIILISSIAFMVKKSADRNQTHNNEPIIAETPNVVGPLSHYLAT